MNMACAFRDSDWQGRAVSAPDRQAQWDDLATHACESNAFYHPALLRPALDLLDTDGAVRPLEVYDGASLIGLLPVETMARHGNFPFANVRNMTHGQCFFGAPLLRRGHEEAAWAGLLAQLDAAPWSGMFLHLIGQDADGPAMAALTRVCASQGRRIDMVERYERALLHSDLDAETYWQTHVRAKKRKELRRLVNRLEEVGEVRHRRLEDGAQLPEWCQAFLALEASGWKGEGGTALDNEGASRAYFLEICANAFAAGLLDMLRIDVDGRAIAMLVSFRHLKGSFSYKIAIDEAFGRYSPGILVQYDNLFAVQGDPQLDWMDSCAVADHAMIDSLWGERRAIAQYRIALKGGGLRRIGRAAVMPLCMTIEALLRRWRGFQPR